MSNTIDGRIIAIGEITEGTSAGGKSWRKQEFAVETFGQYPKKVAFTLFNDAIDKADFIMHQGKSVTIHYNPESREHNGRWFTELKAWKFEPLAQEGVDPDSGDDLP